MFKVIVGLGIIFLVIFGVVIYYLYEEPEQEEILKKSNVSIIATNQENQVESEYYIFIEDSFIKKGKTLPQGYILENLPLDSRLKIFFNFNDGYSYLYEDHISTGTKRIEGKYVEFGELNITHELKEDKKIFINITETGEIRGLFICLDWSRNIIYADLPFKEISKPKRLENKINKCYELKEKSFILTYKDYNPEEEWIELWLVDKDYAYWNTGDLVVETPDLEDLGMEDYIYKINKFK